MGIFFQKDEGNQKFHHSLFNPFSKCFASKFCFAKFSKKGEGPDCSTQKRSRLGPDGESNMVGTKTGVAAYINKKESIRHITTVTLFSKLTVIPLQQ